MAGVDYATTLNGDGPCTTCGTDANLVWFTDSVFWNAVIRGDLTPWNGDEPTLCIRCFVVRAEARGYRPTGWRLLPEWRWVKVPEGGQR